MMRTLRSEVKSPYSKMSQSALFVEVCLTVCTYTHIPFTVFTTFFITFTKHKPA